MKAGELVQEIQALLKEGKPFALAKVTRCDAPGGLSPGDTWIVLPSGRVDGPPLSEELKAFLSDKGREVISDREARHFRSEAGTPGAGKRVDFFLDPLAVPGSLTIAGGGHIAVPLADMAAQTGFRVTVVDDRPDFSLEERFPRAHRVVTASFAGFFRGLEGGPSDYVVIITRGHKHDRECLEAVVGKKFAYIGMIGSRRRIQAVFDHMAKAGIPREALARIHSPIGLDIGALTPAELAVSILSEIVSVRRRGSSALSLSQKGRGAAK